MRGPAGAACAAGGGAHAPRPSLRISPDDDWWTKADARCASVGNAVVMSEPNSTTINVERGRRGDWQVVVPDEDGPVSCQTLRDAQWVAYVLAADRQPCQLVIRDAYHRVVERELIAA